MSTWGDRKSSRFRTRRLARRVAVVAAVIALLLSIFFISLLVALRSETVWSRFVLPRYLGPYWDTALSWDSFEPRMFPPGIAIENLEIREPGDDSPPAVSIGSLDVQLDFGALGGDIDLRFVEVRDLQVHIRKYNLRESNLSRALERIVEGRPTIRRTGPARPFPEIAANSFQIEGFRLTYENVIDPGANLGLSFSANEPIEVRIPENARPGGRPMLTDLVQVRAAGSLETVAGIPLTAGNLDLQINIPNLRNFPANTANGTATITGANAGEHRVEFSAEFPLEAAPFRIAAIETTNIDLQLQSADRTTALATFRKGSLDPYNGQLEGTLLVDASSAELLSALRSFLTPEALAAGTDFLESHPQLSRIRNDGRAFDVYTSATLSTGGFMQYAIIDEAERQPLEVRTRGVLSAERVPIPGLEELASTLLGEEASFTGSLSTEWQLELDRRRGAAAVWLRSSTRPTFLADDRIELGLRIHHPDNPQEPVRFNPFAEGLSDVFAEDSPQYESYDVLPQWEASLARFAPNILQCLTALDVMGMREAEAAIDVTVESGELSARLLEPVLQQIQNAGNGRFSVVFSQRGDVRPASLRASARVRDVRLAEIADPVMLDGELDIMRDAKRLVARTANIRISRSLQQDAPVVFELGLPGEGPMGELGPPAPTFLDLQSGTAHFELAATTIRREVLEVLLRVQTFNLSEQLAQPLYQQMLSMLGFDPSTREIGARADIYMTGDMGPVARINSHLQIGGVPVATFLMLPEEARSVGRKLDVSLLQGAHLDRRTAVLTPERFDLRVSAPGSFDPFLSVRLDSEQTISLDYERLLGFAAGEVVQLTREQAATSIKQLAARSLGRVARFEQALLSGAGNFVFEVPGFDLSQWADLLDASGIPIEGGILEGRVSAQVHRDEATQWTEGIGGFAIRELKFAGIEEPIPYVEGDLEVAESDSEIELRILRTRLGFDNARNPTTVSFRGRAKTDSFESEWHLEIEDINSAILSVLERLRRAGIDRATSLLQSMPTQLVVPDPGESGRVDLSFAANSNAAGDEIVLGAVQTGEELVAFPRLLRPLSFRLEQQMTILNGETFRIDKLDGWLREEEVSNELLILELDNPITIGGTGSSSESAIVSVTAQRDLALLRDRLESFPIPIVNRTIEGGFLSGRFELEIPSGALGSPPIGMAFANTLAFSVEDLRLSGYDVPIDGVLRGRLEKFGPELRLAPLSFSARVGEEEAGELSLRASYIVGSDDISATFDAIELRPLLIRALPDTFSRWASLEDSRLNLRAQITAAILSGQVALDLQARARNLALPPLTLRSGFDYAPPPLNLDLDFQADVDSIARRATVSQMEALVTKGSVIPGDRLEHLTNLEDSILRLSQSSPVSYDLRSNSFQPENPEGVSIELDAGPIDLTEFAPLMLQLYGLPLTQGTLTGTARLAAGAIAPLRRDSLLVDFELEDGIWKHPGGEEEPVAARLMVDGELLPDVVRLNQAEVRLDFPSDELQPVDHLAFSGYFERNGEPRRAELDILSEGLRIGRLVRLAEGIAPIDPRETEQETDYDAILRRTRNVEATFNGEFRNLRYREVSVPALRINATALNNRVQLQQLRSRVSEGDLMITGEADLSRANLPWQIEAALSRLEVQPWVESFASGGNMPGVTGELSGQMTLRGEGVELERLGETLFGNAKIQLRRMDIQHRAIRWLAGTRARLEADGTVLIENNVARLRVDTPWHPEFRLLAQGTARPVVPSNGAATHYKGMVRYDKMSDVGPRGRSMIEDGERYPFRQRLYGILVEIAGTLEEGASPSIAVRSLNY